MQVTTTAFGYLVLLAKEELDTKAAVERIAELKEHGKVAVIVPGQESFAEIIEKFAKVESMGQ